MRDHAIIHGTNDPAYVAAALAIAIIASWVALDLAGRVTASRGRVRTAWLSAGAIVMGVGIWSMHFIAMLGLELPTSVAYRADLVLLSIGEAIGASAAALWVSGRAVPSRIELMAGTFAMTVAIAGMHYTGMAALELHGHVEYSAPLVAASLGVAACASYVALRLAVHLRGEQRHVTYRRGGAALGMGAAIMGMHYTGMAAAQFHADGRHAHSIGSTVGNSSLAVCTGLTTVLILLAALVASAMDRRWKAQRATAVAHGRLATIVESIDDALFSISAAGAIQTWNAGAVQIYGYAAEEALGKSVASLVAPGDAARMMGLIEGAQAGRLLKHYETVHVRGDGTSFDVSLQLAPIRDPGQTIVGVSVIARDITERKLFDRALETSQKELSGLIAAMSDVIILFGADGRYLKIFHTQSPSLIRPPHELLGRTIHEMLPTAGSTYVQARITEALTGGKAVPIEYSLPIGGGTTWFNGNVTPLDEERVLWVARDVTERKQAEFAAEQGRAAADAANRAKGDFLANMSHEIRTPMNGVLGMLELCLDSELTSAQREHLALAHSSAESLLTVINDILDFSKIEAGVLHLAPAVFAVSEVIAETVSTMAVRAHRKGLELTLQVGADVPDLLVGDAGRLRQILVNIIGNAVKFTSAGEVSVLVGMDREEGDTSVVHVSVRDTGVGIPAGKQEAVFAPFVQADSSTTRDFGGTGLGLAISRQIVEAMGGRCWLDSEVGVGTTFHFTVALGRADGAPRERTQPVSDAFAGVRVLVVDDNATNRQLLHELLGRWGMRVTCAGSGSAGLAALASAENGSEPFDVVLLDACMPEMDGFAFAAALRHEQLSGVPILMLSSIDGQAEIARSAAVGIGTYLTKPVRRHDLCVALAQALGLPQTVREVVRRSLPAAMPDGASLRILVAEDHPVNQKLVHALLTKRGHVVSLVGNGREALEAIAHHTFDLVFMDAQMPIMGGLEATTVLRERELGSPQHLPIVAMTARAMAGDRERCLNAGMDDYVSKPIRVDDLARVLGGVVSARSSGTSELAVEKPTGPGGPALLDEVALLELLGGDAVLARELYQLFMQDAASYGSAIRAALASSDFVALGTHAHALRGASANVWATSLAAASADLERLAASAESAAVAQAGERCLARLDETVARMALACAAPVADCA